MAIPLSILQLIATILLLFRITLELMWALGLTDMPFLVIVLIVIIIVICEELCHVKIDEIRR